MASTDLIRDAVDAASDQRYPGTSAQPARFALVLNALDDPVALQDVLLVVSNGRVALDRLDFAPRR